MTSRSERLDKQKKLDKERSLKWRQEVERINSRPFDVSFCHDEEAILRERWQIKHNICFGTAINWTFVRAVFPDDARDYGLKIIRIKDSPKQWKGLYSRQRLKILQSLKDSKLFSIKQSYITNDQKVYIFMDLMGHKNFLINQLKSTTKGNREPKAKMWSKQVSDCLSYLHGIGIAFGHNLNIDNIIVDERDAIKLFGLELFHCSYDTNGMKLLCDLNETDLKYSTPEAMDTKHDQMVEDIYRLGVIIYYLMTDSFPFEGQKNAKQLEQMMASKSWDNEKITSKQCKDLLSSIFVVDSVMRPTIDEIRSHQWFKR